MRIATYFLALASGFVGYYLFALYNAFLHLASWAPVLSAYLALWIFGVLSWLHFYAPRLGLAALVALSIAMYVLWPMSILIEFMYGHALAGWLVAVVPLVCVVATITCAILSLRHPPKPPPRGRLAFAIPASLLGGWAIVSLSIWIIQRL